MPYQTENLSARDLEELMARGRRARSEAAHHMFSNLGNWFGEKFSSRRGL